MIETDGPLVLFFEFKRGFNFCHLKTELNFKNLKTLLLATFVDFWRKGSGHRVRINALVSYLMDKTHITVFFAGAANDEGRKILALDFPMVKFEFAAHDATITFKDYKEKFKEFIQGKNFDIAVIEYIELSNILELLPSTTITMLDTHDLVFERIRSFKKYGVDYDGIVLSKKDELEIFQCYDYVLLIQKKDFEKVAQKMDSDRLLLVPHPPFLEMTHVRETCTQVGYVASQYQPNIDGLKWFIDNVWRTILKKYNLTLNVYGNIGTAFYEPTKKIKNILFHGFTEDLIEAYKGMDIIINPVRCGAGLKIKNVEALGFGIPLMTTSHGASGMEDGVSTAFLVADTPKEFTAAFDRIIKDFAFRTQMGKAGFEYANINFSKEKSYGNLLKAINDV